MILTCWHDIKTYLEDELYMKQKLKYVNGFPSIIHQSWKNEVIPDHWLISQENWLKFHPDYIYILWTDEMNLKLVTEFYPEYLKQFTSYPYPIQRADFSRLLYMKRYGGLYSDLDISPNKNCDALFYYTDPIFYSNSCAYDIDLKYTYKLEDFLIDDVVSEQKSDNKNECNSCNVHKEVRLIDDTISEHKSNDKSNDKNELHPCNVHKEVGLISDAGDFNCYINSFFMRNNSHLSRATGMIAKNFSKYTNMFMISKRGSVFWDRVLLESRKTKPPKRYSTRHFHILWTTGPLLIDRVANKPENQELIYNLPPKYVNPCTVCQQKPCTTKDAYITMLAGSSWAAADSSFITWCSCNWDYVAIIIIIIIAIIITIIWSIVNRKKK